MILYKINELIKNTAIKIVFGSLVGVILFLILGTILAIFYKIDIIGISLLLLSFALIALGFFIFSKNLLKKNLKSTVIGILAIVIGLILLTGVEQFIRIDKLLFIQIGLTYILLCLIFPEIFFLIYSKIPHFNKK